jgi:hypothetical protein
MKTTLKIGLASLLAAIGAVSSFGGSPPNQFGSGASQELLYTFDTGTQGYSAEGSPGMAVTYSAAYQSPLSNPSGVAGGILGTATLGPGSTGNWQRADSYIYPPPGVNVSQYTEFTFDYMMPTTEPLDSSGNAPSIVIWWQWGSTASGDNGDDNVPYWYTATVADGNWHTVTLTPAQLDPAGSPGVGTANGTSFNNLVYLNAPTIGLGDSSYAAATAVSVNLDNEGWIDPVPEPATLALCGIGGLMSLFLVRRKS